MQMHILGVKRVKGVAKNSGNEFDMHMLVVRVPIERKEASEKSKLMIDGAGFEAADIELAPEALPAFKALEGRYPLDVELLTEQRFIMGQFKTQVIGHNHKAVKAA